MVGKPHLSSRVRPGERKSDDPENKLVCSRAPSLSPGCGSNPRSRSLVEQTTGSTHGRRRRKTLSACWNVDGDGPSSKQHKEICQRQRRAALSTKPLCLLEANKSTSNDDAFRRTGSRVELRQAFPNEYFIAIARSVERNSARRNVPKVGRTLDPRGIRFQRTT